MKIALLHDSLLFKGGAERVFAAIAELFPSAPVYTVSIDKDRVYPVFLEREVRVPYLSRYLSTEEEFKRRFVPFGIAAARQLDVRGFDVIVMSTTHCAKYCRISKESLSIAYCHAPFRLLWSPMSYPEYSHAQGIRRMMYGLGLWLLRKYDKHAMQKVTEIWTNAKQTEERIRRAYGRTVAHIIHPPVGIPTTIAADGEDRGYYLIVSRLEPYKRVDLAIEVFRKVQRKLVIVGAGTQYSKLKASAPANVEFVQEVSDADLAQIYSSCKALIFPQEEDFGITPIEANAYGKPVIAYKAGGILETMIHHPDLPGRSTVVFFDQQKPAALIDAINRFETMSFERRFILSNSQRFAKEVFQKNFLKAFKMTLNRYKPHLSREIKELLSSNWVNTWEA